MAYVAPATLARVRKLRRTETAAEKRLWGYLRGRRLGGYKFLRQEPVGPYVADFLCREKKLIVEADGATHGSAEEIAHDRARTVWLEAHGYDILRFWNEDIFTGLDDVLDAILLRLRNKR
ncbi:MAG: endonuclease domain-containing protein [Hyphomicrobiales bacterium]